MSTLSGDGTVNDSMIDLTDDQPEDTKMIPCTSNWKETSKERIDTARRAWEAQSGKAGLHSDDLDQRTSAIDRMASFMLGIDLVRPKGDKDYTRFEKNAVYEYFKINPINDTVTALWTDKKEDSFAKKCALGTAPRNDKVLSIKEAFHVEAVEAVKPPEGKTVVSDMRDMALHVRLFAMHNPAAAVCSLSNAVSILLKRTEVAKKDYGPLIRIHPTNAKLLSSVFMITILPATLDTRLLQSFLTYFIQHRGHGFVDYLREFRNLATCRLVLRLRIPQFQHVVQGRARIVLHVHVIAFRIRQEKWV